MRRRIVKWAFVCSTALLMTPETVHAQQYPITTESPVILPGGTIHSEFGIGHYVRQPFPLSGLEGSLTKIGMLRFGFSFDQNVELQFDGTLYDMLSIKYHHPGFNSGIAPKGLFTHDVGDFTLWTKFRLTSEYTSSVSTAVRFGVQLPNASNESGLGLDEFDFFSSILIEKHFSGLRFVLNLGLGILGDPTLLSEQHDTFLFAFGSYVPIEEQTTVVMETGGRVGHQGIGIHRLQNAKAGLESRLGSITWRLLGVLAFSPADNSRGAEFSLGYEFPLSR